MSGQLTVSDAIFLALILAEYDDHSPHTSIGLFQESIWIRDIESKHFLTNQEARVYLQSAMQSFNWHEFKERLDTKIRDGRMPKKDWGERAEYIMNFMIQASFATSTIGQNPWLSALDPVQIRKILAGLVELLKEIRKIEGL